MNAIGGREMWSHIPEPRQAVDDEPLTPDRRTCLSLLGSQSIGRVVHAADYELPTAPFVQLVCGLGRLFVIAPGPMLARALDGRVTVVLTNGLEPDQMAWEM